MRFESSEAFARKMDEQDGLRSYRDSFHIPEFKPGRPVVYLSGQSLGLAPRKAQDYVDQELRDWARLGVAGHFTAKNPWLPYHEAIAAPLARLTGASPREVVAMNTLTVNLHLMLVSFYQPTKTRYKILIEAGAFPSDRYAVISQIRFHGFDPAHCLIEIAPRPGESLVRDEDILTRIDQEGHALSLVLLGNVHYLTGQAYDMPAIARAARHAGARAGFDLAHGVGNLPLRLHDWDVDFAVWCGYKYLNSGPGGLAGCFIHERHFYDQELPRFAGWWGHDKKTRFQMPVHFDPIAGAEGWQLSNPPIFPLASLRAALELFDSATMPKLRQKSELLTGYLEYLLGECRDDRYDLVTPREGSRRGCQLSLRIRRDKENSVLRLKAGGIVCDLREPDILRVAPVPLYNRFADVYRFAQVLNSDEKTAVPAAG